MVSFRHAIFSHGVLLCIGGVSSSREFKSSGADGAYSDCPCVRRHLVNDTNGQFSLIHGYVHQQNGTSYVDLDYSQSTLDLPEGYGTNECRAWDKDTNPCREEGLEWCDAKWCYVDDVHCRRPRSRSRLFPTLFFSYSTCGSIDTFVASWQSQERGRVHVYAFGNQLSTDPGQSQLLLMRRSIAFAYYAATEAGLTFSDLRYRSELSSAALADPPNDPYSGCVKDISLGNLDWCVGNFWDTEALRMIRHTLYSGSIMTEASYLIGPNTLKAAESETIWELLIKAYKPFAWDLWLLILSIVVACGLGIAMFEFHRSDSDFSEGSLSRSLGKSVYLSLCSFLGASTSFNPVTPSGRLMSIGLGGFVLIAIASLTAETAKWLIFTSSLSQIQDVDEVLDASKRVCYDLAHQESLQVKFPRLREFGVIVDYANYNLGISSPIHDGLCEYIITGEFWLRTAWASGKLCDLILLGRPVLYNSVGFYLSPRLYHIASVVAKLRSKGLHAQIANRIRLENACSIGRRLTASSASSASSAGVAELVGLESMAPKPLEAKHMLGCTLWVILFFLLAIIVRIFEISRGGLAGGDKQLVKAVKSRVHKVEASYEHIARYVRDVMREELLGLNSKVSTLHDKMPHREELMELHSQVNKLHDKIDLNGTVKKPHDKMDQNEKMDQNGAVRPNLWVV